MAAARTERSKDAPAKGRFITFEGGEGSGKSTQVRRLMARLAAMGIETVATREPGGSPEAERLRGLLLSGDIAPFGPTAEALVFTAARIDHIDKTIRPALDEGCFVICDRFTDSTRAYQGATGKVPADLLADLEKVATGSTMPALTIVLDVPVETGLARAKGRGEGADRFEQEKTDFHEAVRQSFIATAKSEPRRCAVIDATQQPDDVEKAVWAVVEKRLLSERKPPEPKSTETKPRKRAKTKSTLRVIEGSGGKQAAEKPRGKKP